MKPHRPIRVRAVSVNGARLVIVDDRGRVWERLSDMKPGEWGAVELPTGPPAKRRRK